MYICDWKKNIYFLHCFSLCYNVCPNLFTFNHQKVATWSFISFTSVTSHWTKRMPLPTSTGYFSLPSLRSLLHPPTSLNSTSSSRLPHDSSLMLCPPLPSFPWTPCVVFSYLPQESWSKHEIRWHLSKDWYVSVAQYIRTLFQIKYMRQKYICI